MKSKDQTNNHFIRDTIDASEDCIMRKKDRGCRPSRLIFKVLLNLINAKSYSVLKFASLKRKE